MLEQLDLNWSAVATDSREGRFIEVAQKRIETFQAENERIPGFEASNFYAAFGVLQAIRNQQLAAGLRFCEWGSGFGVVTCLAYMAGFDARGIEAEAKLIACSRELAWDYDLDVRFFQGSYKADLTSEPGSPAGFDPQPVSPFDCDVVYIYPWPAETGHITERFERFAQPGTLLVSYKGGGRFRIQRAKSGSESG